MDAVFDRVLMVHALEECHAAHAMLREVWRVMAPEGRLVVIAANRWSLWAQSDATPFGHGRPYSRTQLATLLSDAMFEPVVSARALYAPPSTWTPFVRAAEAFERVGEIGVAGARRARPDGGGEAALRQHRALAGSCPFGQGARHDRAETRRTLARERDRLTSEAAS